MTILNQNCIQYKGNFYKLKSRIAIDSPLSFIMAEIFIKNLEHILKHILYDRNIVYSNRYVDDSFIIYSQNKITEQIIIEQFNKNTEYCNIQ